MRNYLPIFLAVIIGGIFGNLIFSSYETEEVMESYGNVYVLQYGAYTDKEVLEENIKKLDKDIYIIEFLDDIYYVYLGITSDYFNALNIQKIYDSKDIFLYIKQYYISDNDLFMKIKDNDELLNNAKTSNEVIELQKKVLNLYKKIL